MKIRYGFVTNSSSSSFLILGIEDNQELVNELLKAENIKLPKDDNNKENIYYDGFIQGSTLSFFGWGNDFYWAGVLNVEEYLENNTLPQAKEKISKLIKEKLNIDILPDQINLVTGEYGND